MCRIVGVWCAQDFRLAKRFTINSRKNEYEHRTKQQQQPTTTKKKKRNYSVVFIIIIIIFNVYFRSVCRRFVPHNYFIFHAANMSCLERI